MEILEVNTKYRPRNKDLRQRYYNTLILVHQG
jgi:hypothetical protein